MENQANNNPVETPVAKKEKISGKEVMKIIWKWVYRLRSVILAIPVVVAAMMLANYNRDHLPETVGINLQSNGLYAQMVDKEVAVMGPLAVTAFCLLLTVSSKKPLFPWVISIFTLVLPPLLWFLNYYA